MRETTRDAHSIGFTFEDVVQASPSQPKPVQASPSVPKNMTYRVEMYSDQTLIKVSDGLRLTLPAIVTLVGYVIMAIIILVPFDMYAWDDKRNEYVRYKYDLSQRIFILLLLMFPLLLGVYSVNCFVVGKCFVLSWVVALITIIWASAVILAALINKSFNLDDVLT